MITNFWSNITFICPRHTEHDEMLPSESEYRCSCCNNSISFFQTDKIITKLMKMTENEMEDEINLFSSLQGKRFSVEHIDILVKYQSADSFDLTLSVDNKNTI